MRNVILKHSLKRQPGVMLVHPPMLGGGGGKLTCRGASSPRRTNLRLILCLYVIRKVFRQLFVLNEKQFAAVLSTTTEIFKP